MTQILAYNLENLDKIESTLDEEDSYFVYNHYTDTYPKYYQYKYPDISYDIVQSICNDFSLFYGKIQESSETESHTSPFPLNIIRFMIDENLDCQKYYTPKRKPGMVVEGYFWTNGFVRRIREDKTKNFEVYELSCILSPSTSYLMSLSPPEKYGQRI